MKNKTFNVIVLILLIVSVAGNILLYSRLKTSTTDNQNLNATISEIQASMDNLENQLSDLQQQLSDSTAKNEELQENNDSLQSELEQLQSEVEFLKSIEPMSVTMYALEDCDTYSKPDESSDKVTTVEKSASLHITGRTSNDWYRVTWGNGVVYIKASLLSDTKPTEPTGSSNSGTTNNNSNSNSGSNSSTTTPSQGSSLTQENVGAILDNLFGSDSSGTTVVDDIGNWDKY